MNDKKQIEEMALTLSEGGCGNECDCIQGDKFNCHLLHSASVLYDAGYRKQSEDCEKRIANQREEIRRLRTRINGLTQSRDVWKKQAERVGKQLHEVLSKQEWISVEEKLPENDWGKHWKERKYYLVYTKPSGLMNVAVFGYKEHEWWIDQNSSCVLDKSNYKEVTHWMPLPEPPKGGAE